MICVLLIIATITANAEKLTDNLNYNVRLGYNLGGTAPIGIPSSIRGMDSYDPGWNLSYGFDVQKSIRGPWGVMTGIHLENKGMEVDARVKNYHMEMVQGGQRLEGYFTGNNVVNVEEWLLTVPIMATYHVGGNVKLKLGPYISYAMSHKFYGHAYNGYLREGTPTGDRINLGNTEEQRGSYDFSDDMRRLQFGIDVGADWYFSKRWGAYADLSWGLTGIHKSDFKTIEQTLYPIFGTVGLTYKLK